MNKIIVTHHGEIIRQFLEDNPHIKQKTFCEAIGLNPSNFVSTLEKKMVAKKYRDAIKEKYALDLPIVETNYFEEQHVEYGKSGGDPCKEKLAEKERTILIQQEFIEALKKQVQWLEKNQKS